jgi:hypothetical protein
MGWITGPSYARSAVLVRDFDEVKKDSVGAYLGLVEGPAP